MQEVGKLILSSHLLFIVQVAANDLEVLLKSQIEDAKCLAKCLNVPQSKDKTLCFQICQLTQENPKADIYRYPKFCTGGCRVACENDAENQEKSKFNYYSLSQCSLSWSVEPEKQNVFFLLAGEDLGGMVNIIYSSLVTTRLSWGTNFVTKYAKLSILAVGVDGIQDKLEIALPRHFGQGCEGEGVTGEQLGGNMNMSNLSLIWVLMLYFSSLSCSSSFR
jgi:hypothetical protein